MKTRRQAPSKPYSLRKQLLTATPGGLSLLSSPEIKKKAGRPTFFLLGAAEQT